MQDSTNNPTSEEVLAAYLPSLSDGDQKKFMDKYLTFNPEQKELLIKRLKTMLPEFRTPKPETNIQFNPMNN